MVRPLQRYSSTSERSSAASAQDMATIDDVRIQSDQTPANKVDRDEQAQRRVRVLIADDSEPVMREIENLLSSEFDIVGKATRGTDLVEEAKRLAPDLIVTDL